MLRTLSKMVVCIGMVCVVQGIAPAAVISTLRNTGVNSAGAVLAHGSIVTNYSAVTVPTGSSTQLVAITGAGGGFPIGPWLGDNTVSRWIRTNNASLPGGGDNDPAGTYVIRNTFNLASWEDHTTASFTGQWATDNTGEMYLNGNLISTINPSNGEGFRTWVAFSATSGFVSGLNTIEYRINNLSGATGNPMGLRVEFTSSFVAVPLPASLALLLTGIPGLAMVRRRIARQS